MTQPVDTLPSSHRPAPGATEQPDPRYADIDIWSTGSILTALAEAQIAATATAYAATTAMEAVVDAAVPRLLAGGRIFYVGAGTSGRIGLQDGVELPPTFGWPESRLVLLLAGGRKALFEAVEGAEDQVETARDDILTYRPNASDVVFGIAASGSTPFTCAALSAARACGAMTVGISSNPQGKLLDEAEFSIVLATGPEVIAGSTRLKAGTAQKATLNMLSTAIMVRLGHGYRGQMVDMRVVNAKLRRRANRMVGLLAGGTSDEREAALAEADHNVKLAVMVRTGFSVQEGREALSQHGNDLRAALLNKAPR